MATLTSPAAPFCAGSTGGAAPLASWTWLEEEVSSTMDEARRLLRERARLDPPGTGVLAVAARGQVAGHGTRGRAWIGATGNVFLTVALPLASLPVAPISLLPLRIGTLIVPEITRRLGAATTRAAVTLKWPNDVLIGADKVAGVLIEMDASGSVLVGVGVNLRYAPDVPTTGADGMRRRATCMASHGASASDADVQTLARDLACSFATALGPDRTGGQAAPDVCRDWSAMTNWDAPLTLRDGGVRVKPIALESDGRLRVRREDDGTEQVLMAEYLE